MRVVDYITMAGKNTWRRPARAILTIIALAISVTIVVTLSAISFGTQKSVQNTLFSDDSLSSIIVAANRDNGGQSLFGTTSEINPNAPKLDNQLVANLQTIPNVASVSPTVAIWEFKSFLLEGSSKSFSAQAQGVLPSDPRSQQLTAGQAFTDNDERHVVILGHAYASALGYEAKPAALIDKTITITTQPGYQGEGANMSNAMTRLTATIIGVGHPGQDENSLFIPMNWAHKVRTLDKATPPKDQIDTDGYNSIIVRITDAKFMTQVVNAIQKYNVSASPLASQFQQLLSFALIVWLTLGAVSIVALIAASIGIGNTMVMIVSEQRYLIGVWRACGATRAMIRRLFLVQATILGLVGGLVGLLLGTLDIWLFNQQVSTLLAAQHLPIQVVANLPWWLAGGTLLLTIVFACLSGLYPAMRAARTDPSQALNSN